MAESLPQPIYCQCRAQSTVSVVLDTVKHATHKLKKKKKKPTELQYAFSKDREEAGM